MAPLELEASLLPHAQPHRPRVLEHRDCPPCGGDTCSIHQVSGVSDLYLAEIFAGVEIVGLWSSTSGFAPWGVWRFVIGFQRLRRSSVAQRCSIRLMVHAARPGCGAGTSKTRGVRSV